MPKVQKFFITLIFFAAVALGWIGGSVYMGKSYSFMKLFSCSTKYTFINQRIACGDEEESRFATLEHEIRSVTSNDISDGFATHVSVYFKSFDNNYTFGVRDHENFAPASLLKVPLMMAYYKQAESSPELLEQRIKFTNTTDRTSIQNIEPQKRIITGETYTIEELIEYMIVYSDNNAQDLLYMHNDKWWMDPYADLGISVPGLKTPDDFLTVKEYAVFFKTLYNSSYLSDEMSNRALELLVTSDFDNGLVAGVPEGTRVAQKFGERRVGNVRQLHDCGIVYHPSSPYLLCIMTRGNDLDKLSGIISNISKLVYESVSERSQK